MQQKTPNSENHGNGFIKKACFQASMDLKELRKAGKHVRPILAIGKNGVTIGSTELIDRELEQKELIKIKFLRAALTQWKKEEMAENIRMVTKSQVVELVGNTLVLFRQREQ